MDSNHAGERNYNSILNSNHNTVECQGNAKKSHWIALHNEDCSLMSQTVLLD